MRQLINRNMSGIIWLILILVIGNLGVFSRIGGAGFETAEPVTEDTYMKTDQYHVNIEVEKDNSYTVEEEIDLYFENPRHGIYRYIPYKGSIAEAQKNGDLSQIPYFAEFDKVRASAALDVSTDNGNKVFRFGEEDVTVNGKQNYSLEYHVRPITSNGYENAYWNIFPTGWRNEIPSGSTFSITFPKIFPQKNLLLYYGAYGQQMNAADILTLAWEGNTVHGTLKEPLPLGNGMTFFVPMNAGYFKGVSSMAPINIFMILGTFMILALVLVLFFFFGRDDKIIPSVQFQPPKGLDSAAVGYIIDGSVSDEDITSLFIFWAGRGFIKIRETADHALAFTKIKELPPDAPEYAKRLFTAIFPGGESSIGQEVLTSSLKYKLAQTFTDVKALLSGNYRNLYTAPSRVSRFISTLLSVIPVLAFSLLLVNMTSANILVFFFAAVYFIGLIIFNSTVDSWYSKARKKQILWSSASCACCIVPLIVLAFVYTPDMLKGNILNLFPSLLAVVLISMVFMALTGFMKKRTRQCVEWMGYLAGLRDFIETAELSRMQVIAKDSPQLFYHILPFAYVFGLSDILLDKMKDLSLPAPDWYETRSGDGYFNYYLMHRMLYSDMRQVAQAISTPRPPEPSEHDFGSFSGGGGFPGGGGGFSGGGFGGGGGGSW